ncbi:thiamine biosynthesis protein ThiF [Shewanella sp. Choline-02u-19]|uniref:HesA/MoeB/ThiF family protein n=1 Tax=unclassified Shewanella TaxID=196818 RepID=UPI000C32F161|nr:MULTISPECIES: HesA/MoeB/ThiF family protein [unclassified Shewanella]PKH55906.1 thiamine biosynthesis protein ThiF [Shewanella sp. Bg11-22]PKI27352.1 thiamine biosynthesis protein ThiF [Shewanella sp. Choline-02u-19]
MALSDQAFMQYSRQILLPEVGERGQSIFSQSHVLIVGVGGLGNLAAQYLAAAGIGQITLIDGDIIERSNLPRQLLFTVEDLGGNKAHVAAKKLMRTYSDCHFNSFQRYLTADNGVELFNANQPKFDLVLDCSDNFSVRQVVNQLAVEHKVTLVSASAANFQGQLLSVNQQQCPDTGCYHCLYPSDMSVSQSCQTVGVLGPMVGTLASMQALMSLNLLLSHNAKADHQIDELKTQVDSNQLLGQLYRFDGAKFTWRQAKLARDPDCTVCRAS